MADARSDATGAGGVLLPIRIPLPHGASLVVRRVRHDDVDRLVALYERLSAEDRYRRFFSHFAARQEWVEGWVGTCQERGEGLVAEAADGSLVGEAAYVLQPNGNGEFSLTVDARWRGWLGPYLLDVLVDVAAGNGVANLEAMILTANSPMRALVRQRNPVVVDDSDVQVQHVMIGTAGRQAVWPPNEPHPRVLVEAAGGHWSATETARRAGYQVLGCAGPDQRKVVECPMRAGHPCPLAADADAIVIAMPPSCDQGAWLAAAHARLHPGVPVLYVGSSVDVELAAGGCRLAAGAPAAAVLSQLDRMLSPRRGPAPSD